MEVYRKIHWKILISHGYDVIKSPKGQFSVVKIIILQEWLVFLHKKNRFTFKKRRPLSILLKFLLSDVAFDACVIMTSYPAGNGRTPTEPGQKSKVDIPRFILPKFQPSVTNPRKSSKISDLKLHYRELLILRFVLWLWLWLWNEVYCEVNEEKYTQN